MLRLDTSFLLGLAVLFGGCSSTADAPIADAASDTLVDVATDSADVVDVSSDVALRADGCPVDEGAQMEHACTASDRECRYDHCGTGGGVDVWRCDSGFEITWYRKDVVACSTDAGDDGG